MLQHCAARLARAKHGGHRLWSPVAAAAASSSAPRGVTANEMRQIMYRTLPAEHTVDYEEDYGHNLYIHREYIPPVAEKSLMWDWAPICRSQTELDAGRRRLAETMNRERNAMQRSPESAVAKMVNTDVQTPAHHFKEARYLFDERRMKYMDRFKQQLFGEAESNHPHAAALNSLMEACAILYGCEDPASRESYFAEFLRLDRRTLADEVEEVVKMQQELEEIRAAHARQDDNDAEEGSPAYQERQQQLLLKPRLEEGSTALSSSPVDQSEPKRAASSTTSTSLATMDADFAPIYASFEAYCKGHSPSIDSSLVSKIGLPARVAERQRWRWILETLANEDFHRFDHRQHYEDARTLSEQLHTVKLFDAKLGEIIKEAYHLQTVEDVNSFVKPDSTLASSPQNPERGGDTGVTAAHSVSRPVEADHGAAPQVASPRAFDGFGAPGVAST